MEITEPRKYNTLNVHIGTLLFESIYDIRLRAPLQRLPYWITLIHSSSSLQILSVLNRRD